MPRPWPKHSNLTDGVGSEHYYFSLKFPEWFYRAAWVEHTGLKDWTLSECKVKTDFKGYIINNRQVFRLNFPQNDSSCDHSDSTSSDKILSTSRGRPIFIHNFVFLKNPLPCSSHLQILATVFGDTCNKINTFICEFFMNLRQLYGPSGLLFPYIS